MSDNEVSYHDDTYKLGYPGYNILLGSILCLERIAHTEKFQERI